MAGNGWISRFSVARLPTVWTVVSAWICDRSRPFCVMLSLLSSVWSTWLWYAWYLLKISHYHVLPVMGLVKVWSPRSIYFWLAFRLFMTIVALCNVTTHITLYKTTRLSSSGVRSPQATNIWSRATEKSILVTQLCTQPLVQHSPLR